MLAPSLLSADFGNLEREFQWFNNSAAQWLHLDIMDGVFVPNISFGFPVLKHVARLSKKPLDVHLMIVEPQKFIPEVKALGAHIMNVHYEACTHLHRIIAQIHDAGMKAGVTLNPATPVSVLQDIVQDVDLVLLMSVNPGFGGQKFIQHTFSKVQQMRQLIDSTGSHAQGVSSASQRNPLIVTRLNGLQPDLAHSSKTACPASMYIGEYTVGAPDFPQG